MNISYSRDKVLKRPSNAKTERKYIVHYMLRQSKQLDLSQGKIIVNGALFLVAGNEATATTLFTTNNSLIAHIENVEKLDKEIRGKFKYKCEIIVSWKMF